MEQQIEATQVCNTLSYLYLLPEDEQLNELKTIFAFIKKCKHKYNKGIDYNPEYIKSLKRVLHLTSTKMQ